MIKIFIFQDNDNLLDVDTLDDDVYPENVRGISGRHMVIAGTLFPHYSSYLSRQAMYQYDAPRDLVIYDNEHTKTILDDYLKKLTQTLYKRGHFITLMETDHSLFIPEDELHKLTNQKLIHPMGDISYSSLWVEIQDEYEPD